MKRSEKLWFANLRDFIAGMSGNSTSTLIDLSRVGLGYGIAIAVGILVLITTIMLASYVCVRVHGQTQIRSAIDVGGTDAATVIHVTVHDQNSSAAAAAETIPGLDQATLDSYPKFVYSEEERKKKGDQSCCSICLGDYKDSDLLRMLPDCRHAFHVACIDAWMRMHATCPMCRTSPLPSPLSTPLSELVPLARHSARIQR